MNQPQPGAALPFAKTKWSQPADVPVNECKERDLQTFLDDYLDLLGIRSVRIPDGVFRWVKMKAPAHIQKWFFGVFGGWPDNLVLFDCGNIQLGFSIELKTATGKLHGKQKHNAKEQGWIICRTPEEITAAIDRSKKIVEAFKNLYEGNRNERSTKAISPAVQNAGSSTPVCLPPAC